VQLFAAATLSWIDPNHSAIDEPWSLWHEIAQQSFAGGYYDAAAEDSAHKERTGASVRETYLVLANRYSLALLGARGAQIDRSLQHALFKWLSDRPTGLVYLDAPLASPGETPSANLIDRWFRSHEILSRFPVWSERAIPAIEWVLSKRRSDGLWDLGSRASGSPTLPLSSSWRRKGTRVDDWTTRVLCLLSTMRRATRTDKDTM